MNIFQEELKRKLPNLECEGMYDEEHNIFSIMHKGYVLGFQDNNGNLNFSRDLLNTDCNNKLDELIEQHRTVKEYVNKYQCAPPLPYDGVKEYRMFAEYGDTILAATYTEHGFMFCTWTQDKKHNYVTHGDYSQNYDYAKESFIVRSGLLNKHRLFNLEEAQDLFKSISYARSNCETLTYKQDKELKSLLQKLAWGYPELEENPPHFPDEEQQTADVGPNML